MTELLEGHLLLFGFLLSEGWSLLTEVAWAWDHPESVAASAGVVGLVFRRYLVKRDVIDRYNQRYEELKQHLRTLVPKRSLVRSGFIAPLFAIRLACVIAAATSGFLAMFLISLLQFVVAPYSFFAAFAAWLGVLPFYVIHFALFAVLQLATGTVFSHYPVLGSYLRVPITPAFIVGWIVVDQLICLILCFRTPIGRPVRRSVKRVLQSVGYGFMNSKTYWLVLLLSLQGFQLDLLALAIAALIPFHVIMRAVRRLAPLLPPQALHWTFASTWFYHYHRMVHLPGVYQQAHRHHHYLTDSTPFDADVYGSGMPEEWFKLMTEISVCLLTGLMPWSFTLTTLGQSLENKIGHTRIDAAHPVFDNFHVNHHAKHVKNFGFASLPLDLLMGTEFGDVSRLANAGKINVRCTKHIEPNRYALAFRQAEPG